MGRFFQHLDIYEDIMTKKVVTRHVGLETPRKKLVLPVDTPYDIYGVRDSKLYSCHSIKESSENNRYSIEAPMKKLINEEISKRSNTRQNAPSIVARLMGVDMLPADLGQPPKMVGKKNAGKLVDKEASRKGSTGNDPYMWNFSEQWDLHSCDHKFDRCSDHSSSHMKSGKPKPREHPQEEVLQKFKKEFEAWQAVRFNECSKVVEFGDTPNRLISQDELNKEMKPLYANSRRMKTGEDLMEPKDFTVRQHEMLTTRNFGKKKDCLLDGVKESLYSNRGSRTDIQPSQFTYSDLKSDVFTAPTKIVILRPGHDSIGGVGEDSWNNTPRSSDERGSIEDFLEEVKQKLNSELQGNISKRCTTVRGGGVETPVKEKLSEPRQIAQHIVQQVRDSVARDFDMNLLRSESTRSYRSDIQLDGTCSPEFINRDSRRLLTERLRNVLKGELHQEVPTVSHKRNRSSVLDYEKSKAGQSRDLWTEKKMVFCESFMNDVENQSRSFRQDPDDVGVHYKEPSPGNLIRSLSAPVSGTSFGKLLLEDRHVLTGAQIRMKHEVAENVSMDVRKLKKDKFNIREKVSSFGYRLTLGGRMFRRRVQSVGELHYDTDDLFKDITSGPTVMMSSCETHENSTEVPPSPASVCSSVCDELWGQAAFSSPISSGANQLEESEMPDDFCQINSNLNDLQRQINQLECTDLSEPIIEKQPHEVEADIDDPAKAYIRDVLVSSGYYGGSCNQSLSKWDPLGKLISNQVFEEVEESYRQRTKVNESCPKDHQGAKINRMMILDLLNETLPFILRQPDNMPLSGKANRSVHKPLHGKELLFRVWENARVYVHPPTDRSYYALDNLLAQDLKSDQWSRLINDNIYALGKDLESLIISDLIKEIFEDM